jgi:IclR family pca regulon transcriptional regulator
MEMADLAQPVLAEMAAQINESCSASILHGTDIIYVTRVSTGRIMQVGLSVGSRLPAYCTSMGRVLLSGLSVEELDAFFQRAELRRLTDRTVTDEATLRRIIAQVGKNGYALAHALPYELSPLPRHRLAGRAYSRCILAQAMLAKEQQNRCRNENR